MTGKNSTYEKPLPSAWRETWRCELARSEASPVDSDALAMLVFRVGAEWFSLPAIAAVEISQAPQRHRIPHRGRGIGVVNVRGRITACLDLAELLSPIESSDPPKDWLIVWQQDDWLIATRVDEVAGVHKMAVRALDLPPHPIEASRFTTGLWTLNGHSVARLDEPRIFAAAREALA